MTRIAKREPPLPIERAELQKKIEAKSDELMKRIKAVGEESSFNRIRTELRDILTELGKLAGMLSLLDE